MKKFFIVTLLSLTPFIGCCKIQCDTIHHFQKISSGEFGHIVIEKFNKHNGNDTLCLYSYFCSSYMVYRTARGLTECPVLLGNRHHCFGGIKENNIYYYRWISVYPPLFGYEIWIKEERNIFKFYKIPIRNIEDYNNAEKNWLEWLKNS